MCSTLQSPRYTELHQLVQIFAGVVLIVSCAVQANKSAVIAGKEGRYPAITAEEFVRESLAAIYVKQEE